MWVARNGPSHAETVEMCLGDVGGAEKLWFFMSQCRKNSARQTDK